MNPPPATATQPVSAPRRRGPRIGDRLTWLGGADQDILRLTPSSRSHFVQMGLVVLATAGIAVLSMSFALNNGLFLPPALAVSGGLVWGCIIAVIDRFLITTLSTRGGWKRVMPVVGLRVAIAALLGVVISTPLVLHIFEHEIQAQIALSTVTSDHTFGNGLNNTPIAKQLSQVNAQIVTDESTLQGHIPPVVTPDVASRQQDLTQEQATFAQLQAASNQKYRAWQCELYGSSCEGSTDKPGNGTLALALHKEYLAALAQTDVAQQNVESDQAALTQAQNAAVAQSGNALQLAQTQAKKELPALRQRAKQLQQQYNAELDNGDSKTLDNNGLLAQLMALGQLGDQNSVAALTHWAVAGLFFMIEVLPVLVKLLTGSGPKSAYERVREMAEDADVDNAKIEHRRRTRQRDELENRIAVDAKKVADVEDDMRTRERDLSIKANERVAKEMEKVLDAALAQWAQQVHNTLYTQPAPNQNGNGVAATIPIAPPFHLLNSGVNGTASGTANGAVNGTAPAPAAVPPAPQPVPAPAPSAAGSPTPGPVPQNVRTNFNLPSGQKLTPSNGGTP